MKTSINVVVVLLATTWMLFGCNKNQDGTTTADSDASPMDELKGVQTDLQTQFDDIMAPINQVDGVVAEFNALSAELQMNAELSALANASLEGGEITFSAELDANVEAKAKVEALLQSIQAIGASLKATPDKVTALLTACAEATATVPALSAKVTASANAKAANILNKEKAAEGKAELAAVAGVEADVKASIESIKGQAASLPAMGAEAAAKLTAAFSGGVQTN